MFNYTSSETSYNIPIFYFYSIAIIITSISIGICIIAIIAFFVNFINCNIFKKIKQKIKQKYNNKKDNKVIKYACDTKNNKMKESEVQVITPQKFIAELEDESINDLIQQLYEINESEGKEISF